MIRAVFKDGKIQPLDPPPSDWQDGRELVVDEAEQGRHGALFDDSKPSAEELDKWYDELEELVAKIDPDDPARIEAALKEQDEQAKAWMRREMGLD